MLTELNPPECKLLGIKKVSLQEVNKLINNPAAHEIGVIQNAGLIVKK